MTSVILSWSNGTILGSWSYQQECSPYHLPLVKEQINGCLSIITSLANIVPISWPRLLVPSYSCALSCVFSETKREKRKDIALHTTVLSENKREKINKKAFCNTIFSRTILVIFFSNNNISNIWLYNAWKRHPVVAFSQKLEKNKASRRSTQKGRPGASGSACRLWTERSQVRAVASTHCTVCGKDLPLITSPRPRTVREPTALGTSFSS